MSGQFNWDEHPIVSATPGDGTKKSFSWNDHPIVDGDAASPAVSGVRKFLQGATAGLSDEAAGATESIGRAIGVKGLGGPMKDISRDPNGPTVDITALKEAYIQGRNHERQALLKDSKDNPTISAASEIAGAIASPINKIAPGASLPAQAAIYGGASGLGNSEADDIAGLTKDAAVGTGVGYVGGKLADKVLSPIISKASKFVGGKLANSAENLAVNATDATGAQASKFSDSAGRELLDRKLVKFGDKPSDVAARLSKATENASTEIDSALKALDAKGVTASADNVVKALEEKATKLEKDPSQAGTVRKLRGIIDDITNTGESKVPISEGEKTKRGFNKVAGNWMDPEAGQAGKQAYQAYRNEVESAATNAAPELAEKFAEAKKTYGLLSPIQEAAERRSLTAKQAQLGGLADYAAVGAGGAAGGPVGALGSLIAKKVITPRVSSSSAVTLDNISKTLLGSPEMAQIAESSPAVFQTIVQNLKKNIDFHLPAAAQNDNSPKNGPDKWAKDGLINLKDHDSSVDPKILDKLLQSKKGKDLLIKASDLKPGSKAMDKLVDQIKSSSMIGGD